MYSGDTSTLIQASQPKTSNSPTHKTEFKIKTTTQVFHYPHLILFDRFHVNQRLKTPVKVRKTS